MQIKELIEDYIKETVTEKDKGKLLNFLFRAKNGKVSQQGMLAAGFDLRNASLNSESKLAETLSVYLDINITEDDLKDALKELKISKAEKIAERWAQKSS